MPADIDVTERLAEALADDALRNSPRKQAERAVETLTALAASHPEAVAHELGLAAVLSRSERITVGDISVGPGYGARIVAAPKEPCACHSGSVCGKPCWLGAHHDGCANAPKEPA